MSGAALVMLGLLGVRRALFLVAASLPRRRRPSHPSAACSGPTPTVALLVPLRNEMQAAPGLLRALEQIDYPPEALSIILIDDCSTDGTREILEPWAAARDQRALVALPSWSGKARALRAGLRKAPETELIAVCDGDQRPRPESLRQLVPAFADDNVAGVTGYLQPSSP